MGSLPGERRQRNKVQKLINDTPKPLTIVVIFIISLFFGILMLMLVQAIPGKYIEEHAKSAVAIFSPDSRKTLLLNQNNSLIHYYSEAHLYQLAMGDYSNLSTDDEAQQSSSTIGKAWQSALGASYYWDDAYWYQRNGLGDKFPADDTMVQSFAERVNGAQPNYMHPQYWDGTRVPLRIFGSFLDYSGIRILNSVILFVLFTACFILLLRNVDLLTALAFLVSCILTTVFVVPMSVTYISVFALAALGVIAVLMLAKRGILMRYAFILFLLLGILTAYFDLFTAPLVTLGYPLVVAVVCLLKSNLKKDARRILLFALSAVGMWLLGYAGFWALKILIAAPFGSFGQASWGISRWSVAYEAGYTTPNYLWLLMRALAKNLGTLMGAHASDATAVNAKLVGRAIIAACLILGCICVGVLFGILKKNKDGE